MKHKSLLFAVIIMAIACLFTACSNETVNPQATEEGFGYITFGNSSRVLSTQYSVEGYDNLYWFYDAVKDDTFGTTGAGNKIKLAGNSEGKGLSGTVRVSQGKWKFTLYAYRNAVLNEGGTWTFSDSNLIYQSGETSVTVRGGETKAVPVSVSPVGDTGKVSLSNVNFYWANGGGSDSPVASLSFVGTSHNFTVSSHLDQVPATGQESVHFSLTVPELPYGDDSSIFDIPADYYTVTAKVYLPNSADSPLVTQTFGLRVYGNAITVITGDLTEGLDSYVVFDVAKQDMKVFVPVSNGITKIDNINAVPDATTVAGVDTKSTTIEFDEDALNSVADKTLQLDVKVTTVEAANNKFNISGTTSDNKSAFAGIDVTLWATDTTGSSKVSNFTQDKYATVTTYIAKGLTNVAVKYNGTDGKSDPIATDDSAAPDKNVAAVLTSSSPATALGYNPNTGLLRFKTNHFSEFYVLADCVALNVTTNVGYNSLLNAINAANDGNTIYLLKNIESELPFVSMTSGKTVNLDLREHTLNYLGNAYSIGLGYGSKLHVSNGTVLMNYDPYYGIYAQSSSISLQKVRVYSTYSGIFTSGSNSSVLLEDCYIESVYSAVYHNDTYAPANISINNSNLVCNSEDDDPCVYISNSSGRELQTLVINNSRITGPTAVEVKHTNVTITDSTLNATQENVFYEQSGNGSTTGGYCLALTGNETADTTSGTVRLSGNTYNSENPGCEVFNSSAVNGVNNGVTIEGYDNAHVLSPDRLMPVCRIQDTNTVYYSALDLSNATAATLKNKTVILQSDEVLSNEIYLSGKTFTLNLNGHSLTLEYGEGITPNNGSVIYVAGKNSKLTINDSSEPQTGAVYGSVNSYSNKVTSAVRVGNYGKLVINGGNYYGMSEGTSCIYVCTSRASTYATVTINGGSFETKSPYNGVYYVLNHEDSYTRDCKITVNGGKFKNYNPGVTKVDSVNAYTGKIVLGTGCTTSETDESGNTFYTVSK